MYIKVLYNIKNCKNNETGGGECWCRRLDLSQKDKQRRKKWRKKIVFGAGLNPRPAIKDPAPNLLG